jgi:hypothetical protein
MNLNRRINNDLSYLFDFPPIRCDGLSDLCALAVHLTAPVRSILLLSVAMVFAAFAPWRFI